MKPSSNWRRRNDGALDIFGNRKRGGCGEPVRKKINVSQSQNLCTSVTNRAFLPPHAFSGVTPHLRASVDQFVPPSHAVDNDNNNNKPNDPVTDVANKLFREQLDQQIAEHKQLKFLQKMQAMEEEKWLEQKVEKERQELQNKLKASLEQESDFGFLRNSNFKNSYAHAHVPTPKLSVNNIGVSDLEERKQTDTETENQMLVNPSVPSISVAVPPLPLPSIVSPSVSVATDAKLTPQHLKQLQIQLDEEKLAWKQKLSEQELEIKRLKLQMLEQQNDQKTTLQYLLKIQTDFSQQIYSANQANNLNLRRPLSGIPTALASGGNHEKLDTPRHQLQHVNVSQSVSVSPTVPREQYAQFAAGAQSTIKLPAVVHAQLPQPLSHDHKMPLTQNTSYTTTPVVQKQQQQQQQNTFASVTPTLPAKLPAIPTAPNSNYWMMNVSQHYEPVTSQLNTARTSSSPSQYVSPSQFIDDQKQESFLLHAEEEEDDEHEEEVVLEEKPLGALLHNESSFLLVTDGEQTEMEQSSTDDDDDDDYDKDEDENKNNICAQLSSSTQFKLSSRPTTAVPIAAFAADENETTSEAHVPTTVQSPPTSPGQRSNGSYSSFGDHDIQYDADDPIRDDTFTIHVVVDDKHDNKHADVDTPPDANESECDREAEHEERWKQISDVDRSNVQSVRSALVQMSVDENKAKAKAEHLQNAQDTGDHSDSELFVVQYEHHESPQDDARHADAVAEPESDRTTKKTKTTQRDILRLPELDASINNFASKVYDVYSSFDESLMASSVVSTKDLSRIRNET